MFKSWICFGLLLSAGLAGCSKSSHPHGVPGDENPGDGPDSPAAMAADAPAGGGASHSSTKPSGGSAPVEAPETCAGLADLACKQLEACAPFRLGTAFGTAAECSQVVTGVCQHYRDAHKDPDFAACAQALQAPYCAAINAHNGIPPVCLSPRGTSAEGEKCGRNADCASLVCQKKMACGTCLAQGPVKASCGTSDECQDGLVCNLGRCAEPVGPGADCDLGADLRCAPGTLCVAGKCKSDGVDGEACGDLFARCSQASGFACRNGRCTALDVVKAGSTCGMDANVECAVGSCSGAWIDQRCVAASELGGPCNPGVCRFPYACVDGKCAVEEASSCK